MMRPNDTTLLRWLDESPYNIDGVLDLWRKGNIRFRDALHTMYVTNYNHKHYHKHGLRTPNTIEVPVEIAESVLKYFQKTLGE
jgi:hypothetical protein